MTFLEVVEMYVKDPDQFAEDVRQVWENIVRAATLAMLFLAQLFPVRPVEPQQLRLL